MAASDVAEPPASAAVAGLALICAAYRGISMPAVKAMSAKIMAERMRQAELVYGISADDRDQLANAMLRDNRLLNAQAVTAVIAHEIRQPLGAIVTNAYAALLWLEPTPPNHDKARETLTSIKSDGHRANDVFDGIRALFGKGSLERQPIDMNRLVLGVTNSLKEDLDRHGVATHYELATELPLVNGYGVQLRRLFST